MGFFDFTQSLDHYDKPETRNVVKRLNKRRTFLIEPFADDIKGARVLDLASHDGRWCYAFAGAGAKSVFGVEARAELIEQFQHYPDADLRAVVTLKQNDLFAELEEQIRQGVTYDVVGVFGILYHVMDHHRMFVLLRQLKPRLIIVDSEFMALNAPMIRMVRERTDNILNAAEHFEGQEIAIKGVPSYGAMKAIADTLGFELEWLDWEKLVPGDRDGVRDYFRKGEMCRATCALRPKF